MTVAEERLTRTPLEAAKLLGIGVNNTYKLVKSGELRHIKVGRKLLIPLTAIDEFLNRKK